MGGEEHRATGGQGLAGGQFGLGVGQPETGGDAHHLAGRAHLGTQQGVGPRETLEGQHRLFHGLQRRHRFAREAQLGQAAAGHQLAGDLGQRHAGGLRHKGHRA